MAKVEKYKKAECIGCGKEIDIHIYASKKSAKCEECRGNNGEISPSAQRTESTLQEDKGPRIDKRPNKALETLCCPYHHDIPMKVVGVINSPMWGDLVTLQCTRPECWLVVTISEQSKKSGPIRSKSHGDGFEVDLSAEEIKQKLSDGTLSKEWIDKLKEY